MKKYLLPLYILTVLMLFTVSVPLPAHAQKQGLVPCGVDRNNPDTPWNETESCELRHTLLLVRNLINFTLWSLLPLLILVFTAVTAAIFYFSLGDINTLVYVKRIWRAVIFGTIIILFSWLFLNLLLGALGFNIDAFGHWTVLEI